MKLLLAALFSLLLITSYEVIIPSLEKSPEDIPQDTIPLPSPVDSFLSCGTSVLSQLIDAQALGNGARRDAMEEKYAEQMSDPKRAISPSAKSVYTLPVVVHIVHYNGQGNVSNAAVERGIERLNQGFANIGAYSRGSGVNTGIQFCLAKRDPVGQSTNGITSVSSPLTNLGEISFAKDSQLKSLRRWDPNCYVNIYVVNAIDGVLGYSNYPDFHGLANDGIVIRSSILTGDAADLTTLIHEMGHYLGLRHTFEGGCYNADCLRDGDMVCDTPPDKVTFYSSCSQGINSCHTDTQSGLFVDQFDLISNFMDYTLNLCRHDFTRGQKDRMEYFINEARYSLLDCPSCISLCPATPTVSIDLSIDSIIVGETITISSINEAVVRLNWYINGEQVGTNATFDYTFESEGTYELVLRGEGSTSFCPITSDTRVITVYCPPQSIDFMADLIVRPDGSFASLTALPQNVAGWEWWLDGKLYTVNIIDHFVELLPGTHVISLIGIPSSSFCPLIQPEAVTFEVDCPQKTIDAEADPDWGYVGELAVMDAYYANVDYIEWLVNGQPINNEDHLEYVFDSPGVQEIVLFGKTNLPGCADYYDTVYFEAICPFSFVDIQRPVDSIEIGKPLTLPVNTDHVTDLQWFVNGEAVAPTVDDELTYTFYEGGLQEIVAKGDATNGNCPGAADTVLIWSYCIENPVTIDMPANFVKVGQAINLTAQGNNLRNVIWYLNGEKVGEGEVLNYAFWKDGVYEITITAASDQESCATTTGRATINAYCSLFGSTYSDQITHFVDETVPFFIDIEGEWDSLQWFINGYKIAAKTMSFEHKFEQAGIYDIVADVFYKGCKLRFDGGSFQTIKDRCQYEDIEGYWEWENMGSSILFFDKNTAGEHYVMSPNRLAKLDVNQSTLWSTEVQINFLDAILDEINGGILVLGMIQDEANESITLAMKYSEMGELLWTKRLDSNLNVEISFKEIVQLPAGNFIILANSQEEEFLTLVFKIGKDGTLYWNQAYDNSIGYDLIIAEDLSIYVTGREIPGGALTLSKLNELGELQWSKIYFLDDYHSARSGGDIFIERLKNGHMVVAHSQYLEENGIQYPYISVFDREGEVLWNRQVYNVFTRYNEWVTDLEIFPNGDILFASYRLDPVSTLPYWVNLVSLNEVGSILWEREDRQFNSNYLYDIRALSNTEIAISGTKEGRAVTQLTNQIGLPNACSMERGRLISEAKDLALNTFTLKRLEDFSFNISPYNTPLSIFPFQGQVNKFVSCVSPGITSFNAAVKLQNLFLCGEELQLRAEICNTGNTNIPADLKVGFYPENPFLVSTNLLAQRPINEEILADSCRLLTFRLPLSMPNTPYLYVFINDEGTNQSPFDLLTNPPKQHYEECDVFNNLDSIAVAEGMLVSLVPLSLGDDRKICPGEKIFLQANGKFESFLWDDDSDQPSRWIDEPGTYALSATNACGLVSIDTIQFEAIPSLSPPNLGEDFLFCEDKEVEIKAGPQYATYRWQDGTKDSIYYISQDGLYWVEVTDACGRVYTDTIRAQLEQFVPIDLGEDQQICLGESLNLNAGPGYANYQWYIDENLVCEGQDCDELIVSPGISTRYIVIGTLQSGCTSIDTLQVMVGQNSTDRTTIHLCEGDTALVFGEAQTAAGLYTQLFQSIIGCDSMVQVELQVVPAIAAIPTVEAACFQQNSGTINLAISGGLPPFTVSWETSQEGTQLTGLFAGDYAFTIEDSFGCTYHDKIVVPEKDPLQADINFEDPLCWGDSTGRIVGEAISEGILFSLNGSPFQSSGFFGNLGAGVYDLTIKGPDNCNVVTAIELFDPTPIELNLPSVLYLSKGDSLPIILSGEIERISQISWTPVVGLSCSDCLMPLTFAAEDVTYQITIIDEVGCEIQAFIKVIVEEVLSTNAPASLYGLDPPNAFSPNNDGKNDLFEIKGLERFPQASLLVVDRWGKVVFQTNHYNNDWDGQSLSGKALLEGTYYYLLYLDVSNSKMVSGNVAIIR
ncbi:MAG: gliding motility-associated C-terminal domain-containing protein [Saprospiraceae bacterium]